MRKDIEEKHHLKFQMYKIQHSTLIRLENTHKKKTKNTTITNTHYQLSKTWTNTKPPLCSRDNDQTQQA